jgi:excisionase family DNA binding protein
MTTSRTNGETMTSRSDGLFVELPDELLERIARRAAELVLERLGGQNDARELSEFLTVPEAADLLRAKPQRVYDLVSSGQLERFKDGSRVLVRRADVVAHLLPSSSQSRTGRTVAR